MIVHWMMDQGKVLKLEIIPENRKETNILTALLDGSINLNTHLLLATKEKPSDRVISVDTNSGVITQEHL
jgi:hypothetical protein